MEEWAHLQLLDDGARIFYNDIHEYFLYMLCVPYVPEVVRARAQWFLLARPGLSFECQDVLNEVSKIVDNRNGFSGELMPLQYSYMLKLCA